MKSFHTIKTTTKDVNDPEVTDGVCSSSGEHHHRHGDGALLIVMSYKECALISIKIVKCEEVDSGGGGGSSRGPARTSFHYRKSMRYSLKRSVAFFSPRSSHFAGGNCDLSRQKIPGPFPHMGPFASIIISFRRFLRLSLGHEDVTRGCCPLQSRTVALPGPVQARGVRAVANGAPARGTEPARVGSGSREARLRPRDRGRHLRPPPEARSDPDDATLTLDISYILFSRVSR